MKQSCDHKQSLMDQLDQTRICPMESYSNTVVWIACGRRVTHGGHGGVDGVPQGAGPSRANAAHVCPGFASQKSLHPAAAFNPSFLMQNPSFEIQNSSI